MQAKTYLMCQDAEVLGLNAVSDGHHVVLPAQAGGRPARRRRFRAGRGGRAGVPQGGRRPQCCTLELGQGRRHGNDLGKHP